jgi:hypothetical protein
MERGARAVSFLARGNEIRGECNMPILLWLLGIPIPIIILLVLLNH